MVFTTVLIRQTFHIGLRGNSHCGALRPGATEYIVPFWSQASGLRSYVAAEGFADKLIDGAMLLLGELLGFFKQRWRQGDGDGLGSVHGSDCRTGGGPGEKKVWGCRYPVRESGGME